MNKDMNKGKDPRMEEDEDEKEEMNVGEEEGEKEEMRKKEIMKHVNEHVTYPTTKQALVEACNNMSHVPEEDKKWFMDTLPEGEYKSPEDVKKALGM